MTTYNDNLPYDAWPTTVQELIDTEVRSLRYSLRAAGVPLLAWATITEARRLALQRYLNIEDHVLWDLTGLALGRMATG